MITEYIKRERWQCFPTAFGMLALETETGSLMTPDAVMELIGHDGSEITHAGLPEPLKRRGFHIQEIIDVALRLGYALTEIQHSPQITPILMATAIRTVKGDDASRRFKYHVDTSRGILSTRTKVASHAWAYENGTIYDPDGDHPPMEYSEEDLAKLQHYPVALWRLDRIAQ